MKVRSKLWTWALALVATFAVVLGLSSVAYAAAGDEPAHSKDIKDNGDGTWTISLSVTGEAEKQPNNANVIVILDTSGSMDESTGNTDVTYYEDNRGGYGYAEGDYVQLYRGWDGELYYWSESASDWVEYSGQRYSRRTTSQTRLEAAQDAVNSLAESLLANNGKDGNPPDTIEIALVTFATHAEVTVGPTTSYSTFSNAVDDLDADGGTNWEDALTTAKGISFGDDDPTYVIFVSDGAPTFRETANGYNDWSRRYNAYGSGQEDNDNIQRCYATAATAAQSLVSDSASSKTAPDRFYTIFAYGPQSGANRMASLSSAAGAPSSNNFTAANTDALNEALNQILEQIEMAGIGNASIADGTTSNVSTSSTPIELLEVDESSYKYYRAGGDYSTTANGGLGDEWTDAPEAEFKNDTVVWDLSSEDVLENGVTYTVTFDVYPSQTALDYAARLKNGEPYESVVPEDARAYFESDGSLLTNTTATLSYDDTRDDAGQQNKPYNTLGPVGTQTESMTVEKKWEGAAAPTVDLDLTVKADDETFATATLNAAGGWKKTINISCGIIKNGNVLSGAKGHDFSFAELGSEQYQWELDAPTVRPMIINGTATMLVKQDADHQAPSGATKYEIDGATYYVDSSINSLVATNHRRSNLNLTKVVQGAAPADATFPFTLTVNNSKFANGSADDTDSDYYVWFSIRDKDGATVTDATVSGATAASGGYYYAPSGSPISVEMKAGWNLRFTNLPSGTTYTFVEGDTSGFEFISSELSGGTDEGFSGSKTTTGTIVEADGKAYTVTYTNKSTTTDVTVTKVWNDNSNEDGLRPDTLELTLNGLPEGTTVKPTITKSEDGNTWTYTWTGVPRYNSTGAEITYTVTEGTVPDHYTCDNDTVSAGGTITNTHAHETVEATVTKVWEDADNQDGIRPDSVVVVLSNGTKVTLNAENSWTAKVSGLPKYADGEEITYTWTEEEVPEGYEVSYGEDGAEAAPNGGTITNTHTPATTEATVVKDWDDAQDQDGKRPTSLNVTLSPSDQTVTLTAENQWTATVSGLPKYANGKEITYTWTEAEAQLPEGYTLSDTSKDGTVTTLTNTHETIKVKIEVEKIWDDADDQDGKRPDSVTVNIMDGETVVDTLTLSGENGWKAQSKELPMYAGGEEIEYTAVEVVPEGYEASYDDTGFIITNKHTPETTDTSVSKVWNDENDNDGKRPESLTISLFADGVDTGKTVSLNEGNGWKNGITGLDKYKNGELIVYTWKETSVPEGYTVSYGEEGAEAAPDGGTITNTHELEKTSITVTKKWDDANNKDGIRPDSVTVNLLADGTQVGTATLNEDNGWTYTWSNLNKYAEGKEISYTVTEDEVEGYTAETTGTAADGFTITNTHVAKPDAVTSDPPVQKVVQGSPATPATFTFQMKAVTEGAPMPDGSADGVKTVQITGSGSYEFGTMTYTEAGEWVYEITELNGGVENYTYDSTKYTLTVKVEEVKDGSQVKLVKTETVTGGNGTIVFTNVYKAPVPKTGDATPQAGMLALAAAFVTGIAAFGALRRED